MNNKPITIKQAIIGLIVAITALFGGNAVVDNLGGSGSARNNMCGSSNSAFSTTTSATQNKLILPRNDSRCNVAIANDSDTKVYIYRGYLGTEVEASTTQIQNIGLPLNANGGTYNMESDGLYQGQIWLGTTTADKDIRISELN